MLFLCFLLLGPVNGGFIQRTVLDRYSRIANTTDGYPCLSGCSPITNECIINWLWMKKPCRIENEPAPIFHTSQVKDKGSKICLSNCGNFGHLYEWCITTADNKWDYCSSRRRGDEPTATGKSVVDSYTKDKQLCQNACLNNNNNKGYWCKINSLFSNVCAKQATSRIPILPSDYKIGDSNKHNCDAFLTNLVRESFRANVSYYDSEKVPDNYLEEVANTVEAAVKLAPDSGLFKDVSGPGSAVQNYTMTNMYLVNGTSVLVPAVIRALVSNSTIRRNQPLIDLRIMEERNRRRRRQLSSDEIGYFNWRIIAYELGGSDEDYNFIRQSPNLYESWLQLQRAIAKWCGESGGSVDIIAVVFYKDTRTVLPKALGAAFTFHNPDGSIFVGCKETIYWNK